MAADDRLRRSRPDLQGLRRLGDQSQPAQRESVGGRSRRPSDDPSTTQRQPRGPRRRRRWGRIVVVGVVCVLLILGGALGYGYWRYSQLNMPAVSGLTPVISGQPINILVIGSDSRAGLTGQLAAQAGAGQVTGQRSDVDMIWHLDPASGSVQILSIPRDTMVSTGALAAQVGTFNRINTAFSSGPSSLVSIIQSNFGIPINHVVEVNFAGFVAATDALGGVWMNFPYPSRDAYSGLSIPTAGCQHLDGTQALSVARSRHFEYEVNGQWLSDGTSDFGRIHRQGAFLRSLTSAAKNQVNPVSINSFLGAIPAGVQIDASMSFLDALDLLWHYRSLDPGAIVTQTLPTTGLATATWGDVLFVDQPAAQQMLTSIFGNQLTTPSTPPPNESLATPPPPTITTTTQPSSPSTAGGTGGGAAATTTTSQPPFDPSPCAAP